MKKMPLLSLLLVLTLSGCTSADDFEDLSVTSNYESIELSQSPSNPKNTITKLTVTLRNSSKSPIYVDAKFYASIVRIKDQAKGSPNARDYESNFSIIKTQEFSLLQWGNTWSAVNEIFEVIQPYEEVDYVVGLSLPTNTYIDGIKLVNTNDSQTQDIGWIKLGFCPYNNESVGGAQWYVGSTCQKGELVQVTK